VVEFMERIAAERRRLREVREMLTLSTGLGAGEDADFVPFYIAVSDYFAATMDRLHEQDIRLGDMLRDKADMSVAANQTALQELDERLTGNQQHLQAMLSARDSLLEHGTAALKEFEQAGAAYAGFIVSNMGHHPGTTDLARQLFTEDDWIAMADSRPEQQAEEQRLYDAVATARPQALDRAG